LPRNPTPRRRTSPGRRPADHGAPPGPTQALIDRVGADGDGIGISDDGQVVYAPFTLPGDAVSLADARRHGQGWLARAEAWTNEGPDRVEAPCRHFGACGGCALQHWADAPYRAWKTGLLRTALMRAGFPDPTLDPLVPSSPGTRRRMDFAARRTSQSVVIGLHRMRSAEIIDLTDCAVLDPALRALPALLRGVLGRLRAPWRQASVIANLLDSGPDLLIRADADPAPADRATLAAFAADHGLPRIAWARDADQPEPVAQLRAPETMLSGVTVTPPPGTFLQATAIGEHAIVQAVLAGLPERLRAAPGGGTKGIIAGGIGEFHAGCGTLTFALAQRATVRAWEGDAAAVAALTQGANRANLAGRVRAERRDLARQPLQAKELAGLAALVLDPPHAGAIEQMGPIAAAGIGTVIYVSCNPAALSRDAAVLAQAGYHLHRATPIDQFLWSARLESVSVFRNDRR